MKILLIDDNEDMRNSIGRYLAKRLKADLTCADAGARGKTDGDADLAPPWDAVVIDRQLLYDHGKGVASGDGLSAAAVFRKDPNYSGTPIIVYSTRWLDEKDPDANYPRYAESGIFLCRSADNDKVADLVEATLGKGPWIWRT